MSDSRKRRHRLLGAVGAAMALTLLAAACGGSSGSSGNSSDTGGAQQTGFGTDVTFAPDGPPQTGGTLVYGLEAESDGFDPASNRLAPAGTEVGLAIYDPLASFDQNGDPQPYLAKSLTPSDNAKTWTITVRSGITFHDGTPLDGAAVAGFLQRVVDNPLVGIAAKNVDTVSVDPSDPMSAIVTMKESWATFPVLLTGQAGMVTAPAMANDPEASRHPVGTGPFVFQSWQTDSSLKVSRNPNYWQKDSTGNQLPYLDAIDFRPLPDKTTRTAAVQSGDVTMIQTSDARDIDRVQSDIDSGKLQIVYSQGEQEEDFIMLNTAKAPLDDIRVRQALAYATDRSQVNAVINDNKFTIADGIFTPGTRWYTEPQGYPSYDPAKAKELVDQYTAEKGPITFELANSGVDDNMISLLQQQWAAVGINVNVTLVEQSQFVGNAALGNYDAYQWRQFGGLDPDYDYIWWTSENAAPIGSLALNFARNSDPQIDAALQEGRASTDFETRKAAYAKVQDLLNQDLPYIMIDHTLWAVIANSSVRGITNGPLPDGTPSWPIGGAGGFPVVTFLTQTWLAS